MLIGIDGNEANEVREDIKARVGVNQYAFKLLWEFFNATKEDKELNFRIFLKNKPKNDLPAENAQWKYEVIPGKRLWSLTKLTPRLIFGPKTDIFFTPNHYLPLVPFLPMACTIHDLGYLKFSGQFAKNQYWQLKYWSAISVIVSKYIICPSGATKKDIVRHYPFASKKAYIVPHGFDSKDFDKHISENVVRQVKQKYNLPDKYLLYIGTLKPSKNVDGLVEAFAKVLKKRKDLTLVIAGAKGWGFNSLFSKVSTLGVKDKVLFTGYVPEEDKGPLMKASKMFLLVSFWEGFGMDVLSALGSGTPAVLSRVASLPEVAGKAAVYVDPYSSEDIARGIETVLEMSKVEYNKLISAGIKRARDFTWEKTGKMTLKVLTGN